jgi:hypothetical protein
MMYPTCFQCRIFQQLYVSVVNEYLYTMGSGWFGSVPLEASGDFGIHPEEGEFHLMCQVILAFTIALGLV